MQCLHPLYVIHLGRDLGLMTHP